MQLDTILTVMCTKPAHEWYVGMLADETGFQPQKIKKLLLDVTSDPRNPTPIRRKDENGDCYVLDKYDLEAAL